MRRPPLITFLTYERLGNTVASLPSLLDTKDDFELYIMDNNSKDDTWGYLQSVKDPRIKVKEKFDQNMGVGHALNWALSHRLKDQDFINFEYDFKIINKNFIQDFHDIHKEFPDLLAFSATAPTQMERIKKTIAEQPNRFCERNGKRIYYDTIMGFCSYFPYETWNQLMYYDEINCLLDMELQARIEVMGGIAGKNGNLGFSTGYAMDITADHTLDSAHCNECPVHKNICSGDQKCIQHYKRIMSNITNKLGFKELHRITDARMHKGMSLECNSIFSGKPMSQEDKKSSEYILQLFKEFTERGND